MNEHAPSDAEWAQVGPLLPRRLPTNLVGTPMEWRPIVEAGLWVEATGLRWRDLPLTDIRSARTMCQAWRRLRDGDGLNLLRERLPQLDLPEARRELYWRALERPPEAGLKPEAWALKPEGGALKPETGPTPEAWLKPGGVFLKPEEDSLKPGARTQASQAPAPPPDAHRAGDRSRTQGPDGLSQGPVLKPGSDSLKPGLSQLKPGIRGFVESVLKSAFAFRLPRLKPEAWASAPEPERIADPLPPWTRDRGYEAPTDAVGPVRMVEISAVSIRDLAKAIVAEQLAELGGAVGGKNAGGGAGKGKGRQILAIVWPDLGKDKQFYAHPITVLSAGLLAAGYLAAMLALAPRVARDFGISDGAADLLLIFGVLALILLFVGWVRRSKLRESEAEERAGREADRRADREADRRRLAQPHEPDRHGNGADGGHHDRRSRQNGDAGKAGARDRRRSERKRPERHDD